MKDKPIGVCTICNKYSYNLSSINKQCSERSGNKRHKAKRCKGVFQSALNLDDWITCSSCKGEGSFDPSGCYTCQGSGWMFNRDK